MKRSPLERLILEVATLMAREDELLEMLDQVKAQRLQKMTELNALQGADGGEPRGDQLGGRVTDKQRVRDFVTQLMPGAEFTTIHIAEELGIKSNSISAYLSELKGAGGLIEPAGGRGKYRRAGELKPGSLVVVTETDEPGDEEIVL